MEVEGMVSGGLTRAFDKRDGRVMLAETGVSHFEWLGMKRRLLLRRSDL